MEISFKDEKIHFNGLETFCYDGETVYSLDGDFLFSAKGFCERFGFDNTCPDCNDVGMFLSEEICCFKPASECCGGCVEKIPVVCECENKIFDA